VAALDADSEGEEGKFYIWSRPELTHAIGEEAQVVADLFGVAACGEELQEGTLHRRASWAESARDAGQEEGAFRERVRASLDRLRLLREGRVHPGVDTKVLTDWNALAASAFLDGFGATSEEGFLRTGLATLDRIWDRCWDGALLHHVWDGERARIPGFLADYAYLARGYWKAFGAAGDPLHLERAALLARAALARFRDAEGRLYDTAVEAGGDLLLAVRDGDDGVLPSAVGVLAQVLWDLERLTSEEEWVGALDVLLASEAGSLNQAPGAQPLLAGLAALRAIPSVEIVVAAPDAASASALLSAARRAPAARALVVPYLGDRFSAIEAERLPLLSGRRQESTAAAFVCIGGTCRLPVACPNQLAELLKADPARLFAGAPEN
jgi:hypothetical protein